jgi:putative ABC transport system substrate-binding protein
MKTIKMAGFLRVIAALFFIAGALSACGNDKKETSKEEKKSYTVGIVNAADAMNSLLEGYKTAMGELGYTEGENFTYVYNGAVNNIDGLDAEVQKMVDAKVDMILAVGTAASQAAKRVTAGTTIPVLFFPASDPVGAGLVDNLQHPGGNLTGVRSGQGASKQLEWLKTTFPDIQKVYAPYNPNDAGPSSTIALLKEDAPKLGIDLVTVETTDGDAVLAALDTMPSDIDAILMISDLTVGQKIADYVAFTLEHKIPLMVPNKVYTEQGALMGFGGDQLELGRQAAALSQKILNGTPAGDLPVESQNYYLTINLVTAEAIGVTIPDEVLQAATTVIRP